MKHCWIVLAPVLVLAEVQGLELLEESAMESDRVKDVRRIAVLFEYEEREREREMMRVEEGAVKPNRNLPKRVKRLIPAEVVERWV